MAPCPLFTPRRMTNFDHYWLGNTEKWGSWLDFIGFFCVSWVTVNEFSMSTECPVQAMCSTAELLTAFVIHSSNRFNVARHEKYKNQSLSSAYHLITLKFLLHVMIPPFYDLQGKFWLQLISNRKHREVREMSKRTVSWYDDTIHWRSSNASVTKKNAYSGMDFYGE